MELREKYPVAKTYEILDGFDIHRTSAQIFAIVKIFDKIKNRTNIIVTRNNNLKIDSCEVVNSIEKGILLAKKNGETECFIIGGGQIYKMALGNNLVDRMYITHIEKSFNGDTFFPEIDYSMWGETQLFCNVADKINTINFEVVKYDRLVVA